MLRIVDIQDFDQVYKLMEMSFPVDEHRPYEEQKALFEKDEYRIYGFYDRGILQGFLATWDLKEILFVEHFAVDPSCRNLGIGSKMLKELLALSSVSLCLEVELPESEITRRRIAFYERNGFHYHDYTYLQPALSKGQKPVPLKIMITGDILDETSFEKIKKLLYKHVYEINTHIVD